MRPLKPSERQAILKNKPDDAAPEIEAAIDEYEALLSEQFKTDPSAPRSPEVLQVQEQQTDRIRQLFSLIYDKD